MKVVLNDPLGLRNSCTNTRSPNNLYGGKTTGAFHAKVGKKSLKQFPKPVSVGKLDVGNFAFSNTVNTLQARNYLKYFQRGSKSVIYCLINCSNNESLASGMSPRATWRSFLCILTLVFGFDLDF